MAKFYLYPLAFATLFVAGAANAQPMFSAADINPVDGDAYVFQKLEQIPVDLANTGPNTVWDYSLLNMSPDAPFTVNFHDVAGSQFDNAYPGANIFSTSTAGGHNFYTTGQTVLQRRAQAPQGGNVVDFSEPQTLVNFPMQFNDAHTSTFTSLTQGPVPTTRQGTVNSVIDGYGTLILPTGTLNDVLRVRMDETGTDSHNGTQVGSYTAIHYMWFKDGLHYPVMSVSAYDYGVQVEASGQVMALNVSSRPQHFATDLITDLYPNPASVSATLRLNAELKEPVTTILFSSLGQEVRREIVQPAQAGVPEHVIPLNGLATGVYYLRLESGQLHTTRKLIIE